MKAYVASMVGLLAFMVLPAWVAGQNTATAGPDEQFLIKALTSSTGEIKASEYAAQNATNTEVKAYANQLIKDHTKLNSDLVTQAKGMKVAVVTGLDKDQAAKQTDLTKLTGGSFDRAYLKMMIDGHNDAIALFQKEAQNGQNAGLKNLAEQTLPALRQHLQQAQTTLSALKN